MSDLVYQNYNNKCKGWVNPSSLFFGPQITTLTGYQSPAGSNTVVSIAGTNFFSYSVIRFGTFTPTVYFINSTLLSFYVPNTLTSGTYPVQVCNGSVCSNIVNYTIDMSSGYWMINAGGNTNTISNTNPNGVQVSWLSRGNIFYVSNTDIPPKYDLNNGFPITNFMNWISCNGGGINSNYLTLPIGTNYIGREIMIKSIAGDVFSVYPSSNIIQFNGSPSSTNLILNGVGWVTLVNKDGTNWEIMQRGS